MIWPVVKGRLHEAISDWAFGEFSLEDLFDNLIVGRSQLWIVNDAKLDIKIVAISRILQYPRKKRLLIEMIVGGGVVESLHVLEVVETWMRQFGATEIEAHVRPALARVLEHKAAFKRSRVVLFREPVHADLPEVQRKLE